MARECPVIATRATGAEDLFRDAIEGFIVADRDVDALTQRMQQIADDPALAFLREDDRGRGVEESGKVHARIPYRGCPAPSS